MTFRASDGSRNMHPNSFSNAARSEAFVSITIGTTTAVDEVVTTPPIWRLMAVSARTRSTFPLASARSSETRSETVLRRWPATLISRSNAPSLNDFGRLAVL
jgi:hypothetical protein